ncbi:MAG: hypothetical protein FWE37_03750 [Spirochaetaceae bacterium]|nr:hypothetical protein [Spirochaetaceae bacterium]
MDEENRLEIEAAEDKEASERTANDYFMMGVNAYIFEVYDQAAAYFTEAINLEQNNARAYLNRGDAYLELAAYHEAFNDYMMASYLGNRQALTLAYENLAELVECKRLSSKDEEHFNKLLQSASKGLQAI